MRQHLNALVTERALVLLSSARGAGLLDAIPEHRLVDMKNVCARLSPELAARLQQTVELLGVTRRRFLEAAIIDALDTADRILESEGVPDLFLEPVSRQSVEVEVTP
jgi:hypothetical protein